MLCPEVWDFKAPDFSFTITEVNDQNTCLAKINKFYYNHLVSITLPDTLKEPVNITDKLNFDCEYYKVTDLNVSDLIDNYFINFLRSGRFTLLSINTRIDSDNCMCVTPCGKLILNLSKADFDILGLQGNISYYLSKTKSRYIVTIDLISNDFTRHKKLFEKTKARLEKLNFTVITFWEPPNEEICPSAIAKYFSDLGYSVNLCKPACNIHTTYSVKVPIFTSNSYDVSDMSSFAEWLGMISVNADSEGGAPDDYITTYETPEPSIELGQVKQFQWRGLLSCRKIGEMLTDLKKFVIEEDKPWATLYTQGFSDSPVAWGVEEHHYFTNGDNGYLFILTKDKCVLCTQTCSQKRYK